MAKKPLLIFPKPTAQAKTSRDSFPGNLHFATKEYQVSSLENRITNLERVLENQTAYLGVNPANMVAEMILVLEIAGDLSDFFSAVAKTPGMEFLSVLQAELDPNDEFYLVNEQGERTDKKFGARLFLTMTNQQALRELQSYWLEYKKDLDQQTWRRGTKKFSELFSRLVDLRPYSVADRLHDTGIDIILNDLRHFQIENLYFEVELAFKNNVQKDERAFQEVELLLRENNGSVVPGSRTLIPEINYHAFIATAPIGAFDDLSENTNISFLKSQQVLFFRPVGQSICKFSEEPDQLTRINTPENISMAGLPVIALFDGLPLQNHALLTGKLVVDDPDDFARNYVSEKRIHGTAMASLILNGDFNQARPSSLVRPIYVRPIMKPNAETFNDAESLPIDKLPLDIIHRAVKRMFDGEDGSSPTAPNVKVINFSIGDPFRPFHINISTWAKLIDWLSYKYNVLFVISAGNKVEDMELDIPNASFDTASPGRIQIATLKKIIEGNYDRKILTPAESVNSLTVGSAHSDLSVPINIAQRKDLFNTPHLFSPISRIGYGFNNSVKPEILMPGGRKLYRKAPMQLNPATTQLRLENIPTSHIPPGNCVALPGTVGDFNAVGYLSGTSNAAALTTNLAGQLYEMLVELNGELGEEERIKDKYFTVIIKALLAHGASWGQAFTILDDILRNHRGISGNAVKRNIGQYLGYGAIDSEKILYCTDHRVTLIGFGELSKRENENAHLYSFPLPASIGQKRIDKKLAITLAWLSPLNFKTNQYRNAHLFFDNLDHNGHVTLARNGNDFRASQKGTLQHDVLTGNNADAFIEDATLNIKVNCRQDATGLSIADTIPYALTVTLEIQENVETMIYEEIKERLQQRIRPRI
jgi:hypothetical protein